MLLHDLTLAMLQKGPANTMRRERGRLGEIYSRFISYHCLANCEGHKKQLEEAETPERSPPPIRQSHVGGRTRRIDP
jgi:hypothetical protein